MFGTKRAGFLLVASATTLAGCDSQWLRDLFEKLHDHHHGPGCGHEEEECPTTHFPAADDPTSCQRKTTTVSAGVGYTCATLAGGALKCWGGDSWYRLGYGAPGGSRGDAPGELGDALPAIPLGAGQTATQVYADSDLTCAILQSGNVKCWGYNGYGAVTGIPNPPSVGATVDTLPERTFSGGRKALQVAAGSGTGYALLDDGSIVTIGTSIGSYDLGAGRVAVQFGRSTAYDDWHLCAVLEDGSVACKGAGPAGELGRNPASDVMPMPAGGYALVDLGTGRSASEVALGDHHTCALLEDGDVMCWGLNNYGQLGQGDTTNRGMSPADMGDALLPVPLGGPAIAIAAGRHHTCALLEDNSVKCWGRNDAGQLGIGSTEDIGDEPGEVAALASVSLGAGRSAVAIDAGSHSCALLDDGSLKCWGGNATGELGQGDVASRGDAPGELGDALAKLDLGS